MISRHPVGKISRTGAILIAAVAIQLPLAAAPPDAEIAFVSQFGERGNGGPVGSFYYPHSVAIDSGGSLVILEWGNSRIQRCDYAGQCELIVEGFVNQPAGMALDSDDRMILTFWPDAHYVTICNPDGDCPSSFGDLGDEPGQFNDPAGHDIDSQGRIVIADRQNDRMQFCDYQGNCTVFGSFNNGPGALPGEFWEPAGVLADGTGRIFIGETGDEVISVCDESGECVARMGSEGDGIGEFKTPSSLALTSRGDLVVLEVSNHRLQVCDISDYVLEDDCIAFGELGIGPGQFRSPHGIVVDEQDRIVVVDQDNHRIQVLQLTYNNEPQNFRINAGLNDAWFNPKTAGQGFFVTVFEELGMMFLAWFTYDSERPAEEVEAVIGEPGHRWITAFGPYEGDRAVLELQINSGGTFGAAEPAPKVEIDGTVTVEFDHCNSGSVTYDMPGTGKTGFVPIERITLDNVARCSALATE